MNTNQSKPTLETLLQSKRHDLPGDDFWIDLQNQVQGKALASLSEPSITSRFLKYSYLNILQHIKIYHQNFVIALLQQIYFFQY